MNLKGEFGAHIMLDLPWAGAPARLRVAVKKVMSTAGRRQRRPPELFVALGLTAEIRAASLRPCVALG